MSIIPVGDRVLIKPQDQKDSTKQGLKLHVTKEKQDQGTVLSVGDGDEVKDRFKKGDIIIYQKYGPAEILIKKEEHYIVHVDEILGKEGK